MSGHASDTVVCGCNDPGAGRWECDPSRLRCDCDCHVGPRGYVDLGSIFEALTKLANSRPFPPVALLLVVLGVSGCGAVELQQSLTAADGGTMESATPADVRTDGADAGEIAPEAGADVGVAALEVGPLEAPPAPCFVATSATICSVDLANDRGCFTGCKDAAGVSVSGDACTSAGAPHRVACVLYCSLCPSP